MRLKLAHALMGAAILARGIVACGGSGPAEIPEDSGGGDHEAPADATPRDATLEGAGHEASAEATFEGSPEASREASSDSAMETSGDARPEAAADASGDAGAEASADGSDGSVLDGTPDAPIDVFVPPPVGTQLQAGNNLSVRGVTGDGYVVFSDDVALALYAMPLAGGTVQNLGSLGSAFWVNVYGNVVFLWSNVTAANVGALSVWSSATGLNAIAPASFGIIANSSSSGQILYIANVDAQAVAGDVYVANGDGTGAVKLVPSAQLQVCYPNVAFPGSYALVSYCAADAGGSASITSFATPGWTPTTVATGASDSFWTDPAGTEVLYSSASGGVYVIPIGGGTATLIDATGESGFLTANGSSAVYDTPTHLLRQSPVSMPSPTTLVSADFGGWEGLSNDQQFLVYYEHFNAGAVTDLFLTTLTAPATQYTLSAAQTAALAGDPFTADSTHVIYATGVNPSTDIGTLNAFSIANSTSVVLGQNVWQDRAATAAKVVFDDNYLATGGYRFGRADIESVDTAQAASPTRIVTDSDAVFALSPAGDEIVYVWSAQPGPLAGLWITSVP
jgi:hypothetical protein